MPQIHGSTPLAGRRALITGSTGGLGLAIARSLTELHQGTLRIRSTPGVGTIVLLRLPLGSEIPMVDVEEISETLH